MFYIMEHLEGRIFWDPSVPEVSKKTRSGLYNAMCKILADLHSVDIEKIGLSDFGKPGNYFARQTDRWVKQYRIARLKEDIVMEKVITFLENNLPLDDEQISLVHGDYRLDNMIFDNNHPKIIGLLDWELSTLGHPLADLAYQCMQWRLPYQGGMRGLNGLNRTELGIPLEEEYVEKYCEIRGISKIDKMNGLGTPEDLKEFLMRWEDKLSFKTIVKQGSDIKTNDFIWFDIIPSGLHYYSNKRFQFTYTNTNSILNGLQQFYEVAKFTTSDKPVKQQKRNDYED